MKEHNNRKKANKYAEYITGQELRKYLAEKVVKYCGETVSIFDGAAGSGQLEEHLNVKEFHAVEIQQEACEALQYNYPKAVISNMSFFQYDSDYQADVVIMNPPFSLKFKEQTDEDKKAIQEEFSWKKSGVVDDIFLLKSLKYTKRFAFYIMFPGITYRGAEKKMREIVGNRLLELNVIENAFEDTQINVVFIVIDKEKTDNEYHSEIYNCKTQELVYQETQVLDSDYSWQILKKPVEEEVIDIDEVNRELDEITLKRFEKHLAEQLLLIQIFNADIDYLGFIKKAREVLTQYETEYLRFYTQKNNISCNEL